MSSLLQDKSQKLTISGYVLNQIIVSVQIVTKAIEEKAIVL